MRWSLQSPQDLPVTRLFVFYLIKIYCLLLQLEEAKKALDQMDVDKDGKVSYPEFLLVMKYKKWAESTPVILLDYPPRQVLSKRFESCSLLQAFQFSRIEKFACFLNVLNA